MNQDDFKAMFDFGVPGEKVVGDWLESQGIAHFALHTLGMLDHGPRLKIEGGATLACPDFICWGIPPKTGKASDQFFVEVKRLRKWWDAGGTSQTGIEESKVVEYRRLAEKTAKRVLVYFLHLDEYLRGEGLFQGDISTLEVAGETFPDGKKLLMFDRASLVHLASRDDLSWFAAPG